MRWRRLSVRNKWGLALAAALSVAGFDSFRRSISIVNISHLCSICHSVIVVIGAVSSHVPALKVAGRDRSCNKRVVDDVMTFNLCSCWNFGRGHTT